MNTDSESFRLRFASLFHLGRGYVFPCDASGRVNLDQLSEYARNNYFYARAMAGRQVTVAKVERSQVHRGAWMPGGREFAVPAQPEWGHSYRCVVLFTANFMFVMGCTSQSV